MMDFDGAGGPEGLTQIFRIPELPAPPLDTDCGNMALNKENDPITVQTIIHFLYFSHTN